MSPEAIQRGDVLPPIMHSFLFTAWASLAQLRKGISGYPFLTWTYFWQESTACSPAQCLGLLVLVDTPNLPAVDTQDGMKCLHFDAFLKSFTGQAFVTNM